MNVARRMQRRDGKTWTSPTWHVCYTDATGIQRRLAGFTDRRATETLGRRLEELVACRATGTAPALALARFVDGLPGRILKHLRAVGLLDEGQVAGGRPLTSHVVEWAEHLRQKGDTDKHVEQCTGRALALLEAAGARYWGDVKPERIEAALADWRDVRGVSVCTCNAYRSAAKQFCRWLCRSGRAPSNPLEFLSGQNPEPYRRHPRRALTAEECGRLLNAAYSGPLRHCLPGPERALLYRLALESGLRLNELRTLQVRHLDLDSEPPTLTVEATYAKAGRTDVLPLRGLTATLLKAHCQGKLPAAPVFNMRKYPRAATMLRADLKVAGISYADASGRVVDFHALRHTFITHLARAGVHPRTAQALARHSTLEFTMQTYTHVALDTKSEALAALPDLGGAPAVGEAVQPT